MFKNIKHIFFDLDHTLWDFEENSKKSFQFIFKKNNIQLSVDEFLKVYSPINFDYWKLFREEKITKTALRFGRLFDVFEKLNYKISKELINILADDYLESLSNYNQLFDGTISLLDYLKPKYQLHIITNGFEKTQLAKIKNSKLLPYFEQIISSESINVKKPNPKIFFHALKKAKANTYDSIMIGDSLEADIYGANNVGMRTIYFNENDNIALKNQVVVKNLTMIKQYL